jgi:lysophospholipase L1-like esterase
MKNTKWLFLLSISLNIVALFFILTNQESRDSDSNIPPVEEKRSEMTYWLNRQELFESLPKDSNSIVFLGNSLTQNFELSEFFPGLRIKNRGINGDLSAGILGRINSIIELHPSKIFIEMGINDLGTGVSNDSILKNYRSLIDILQRECKSTKIFIQSAFPVENSAPRYPTFCNERVNAQVVKLNTSLEELAREKKITFVNVYPQLELNGQLNSKYSVDGIHLNGAGYLTWANVLKPFLEE